MYRKFIMCGLYMVDCKLPIATSSLGFMKCFEMMSMELLKMAVTGNCLISPEAELGPRILFLNVSDLRSS